MQESVLSHILAHGSPLLRKHGDCLCQLAQVSTQQHRGLTIPLYSFL